MVEKHFIQPQELYIDSCRLARKVLDSDFRPTFIVALWRGGTPVGCAVQEFLEYKGVRTNHISIRTSAYEGIGKISRQIRVHELSYLIGEANAEDKLLLVDDVFDSGQSLEAVIRDLRKKSRLNAPREIKIATIYYKPNNNKAELTPDFYLYSTDRWLVFPHELVDLSQEEIMVHKGKEVADLLNK
ncbi:hypoxanthine phosphoribosyltransferase [Candidatus Woesearchaeota archaeon]|nr:hypoxanthine phosphoribosyltransferase [Candidatus Woesearchaeota archaeon]